jgi:hypothetical protein
MTRTKTKAVAAIEAKMKEVAPGSYRHLVLTAARDFKNAWIELGSHLTKVRDQALYKEWGHPDFETYCQRELHIKKATAHKLTATYAFMERHEPGLLQGALEAPPAREALPPFEVIEVLSRAEERGQIGPAEYRAVRDTVLDEERPPTPAGLRRMLNESYPPPPPPEPPPEDAVRRLARAARKLADGAEGCDAVPRAIAERAEALAADFEAIVREAAA